MQNSRITRVHRICPLSRCESDLLETCGRPNRSDMSWYFVSQEEPKRNRRLQGMYWNIFLQSPLSPWWNTSLKFPVPTVPWSPYPIIPRFSLRRNEVIDSNKILLAQELKARLIFGHMPSPLLGEIGKAAMVRKHSSHLPDTVSWTRNAQSRQLTMQLLIYVGLPQSLAMRLRENESTESRTPLVKPCKLYVSISHET
jgi:hypothetical protein